MRVLVRLLCLSLCLYYVNPAIAQQDTTTLHHLTVKFSPQHLLVNGIYLEVVKSLPSNTRHSLIVSPRVYYGGTVNIDSFNDRKLELNEKNEVQGFGLAIQHRIYLPEGTPVTQQGMYVAYGFEYNNFNIDFERGGYIREVDEEGLEYYRYGQRLFREKIDRVGIMGMGGLQMAIVPDKILADLSLGVGYRKSYSKTDYSEPVFNVGPTDFGYTGIYVLANLKFGYMF